MAAPLPLVDLTEPIDETLTARQALAIVARLLQQAGTATLAVGGSVLFVIGRTEGAEEMETWRVDLDQVGGHWVQSVRPASVTVVAARDALPSIINAPGEVAKLHRAGAFLVRGDRQRLEKLATLLGSAGNAISVRFPGAL